MVWCSSCGALNDDASDACFSCDDVLPVVRRQESAASFLWRAPTVGFAGRHMLLEGVARPSGPAKAVRARILHFLKARGYTAVAVPGKEMAFRRGSWRGSLTSFSPSKWQALVTVNESEAEGLRAVFDMNTTGQHVLDVERDFWTAELGGLQAVIEGSEPTSMVAAEKPFEGAARRVVKAGVIDALAQGIVAFLLLYFLGDRLRSWLGRLFGG